MIFNLLCDIFGVKWGFRIYLFISKIFKYSFLIKIILILISLLGISFDVSLFDGGDSSSAQEFVGRDVLVQKSDSRPIPELGGNPISELDSRPKYELDSGKTHFDLWDKTQNVRNSTESRTYQAYHPGLIETSNGFRSELPADSIKDTYQWKLHSRISNPDSYPANLDGEAQSNASSLSLGEFGKKTVHFKNSYANSFSESKPKSSNFFVDLFKSFKNGESYVEGGGWVNGGDLRR